MNIEGIKGSIDLSTENVFKELDRLESRLNKFADSRGNDGDVIANEMKTILNVIAGSQIEFADNLKKAFDTIEQQHLAYGRKARRIERDVTKAMVAEMVERNQAFANAYAKSSQDFLDSQTKLMNANRQLTMSKLADREDRNKDRAAGRAKAEELARDREIAEQANEIFMRSMAQQKEKERAIRELAELRMADFRRRKKEHEEAVRLEKKAQKEQEAAVKASLEKRRKMIQGFASGAMKILKGIVWFPVIANQSMQMFQSLGYTLKSMWDNTVGQIIKVGAEVESYMVRLKVSTGTLMAAREVWKDIEAFATESVYGFDESVQSATALLPILRNGRNELKQWQPVIADIAAGFGLSYEEATSNFVKLYAAGAASADLFRERGVLAALGFTPGEKVSGRDSADVVMKSWENQFSVFRGAADELSRTWLGVMNKIKDQWFLFVKDLGETGIFEKLKRSLEVVLDRFNDLRGSGEDYKKLLNDITKVLERAIQLVFSFFSGLAKGIMALPIIGDKILGEIEESNITDSQKKIQKEIDALLEKRNEIQPAFSIIGPTQKKALNEIDAQVKDLRDNYKEAGIDAADFFSDTFKALLSEIEGILRGDPLQDLANEITKLNRVDRDLWRDYQKGVSLKAQAEADLLKAENEAMDRVKDKLQKAQLESIKYSKGEWAAFVEETRIEAEKMGEKVSDAVREKGHKDPEGFGAGVVSQYFSATLDGKIKEYRYELDQVTKDAQKELRIFGMTDAEKARFELDDKYSGVKWKGLPESIQKELEAARKAELDVINEEDARRKSNETLQHSLKLRALAIPSWDQYGQKLAEIKNEYELATEGASDLAIAEAKLKKDIDSELLDKETVKGYREQIDELRFTTSQFGLSKLDQEVAAFNRTLDRLVNSEFAAKNPQLVAQLKELMQLQFNQQQVVSFKDGWEGAMRDIRDSMMTDGQAIKTFLMDVFSGLSSGLEDVFFEVFKGNLKDAAKAFESFADAIMKSVAQIMANQVASQLTGGMMSMMAGIFHTGGIAGMGGVQRAVNPLMFVGAPRYHSGGIAGLAPGEIPAVLKAGEIIQTPEQYARRNSGGGVSVAIKNESGQTLKVTESRATQDMSGWVISVVLDAVQRDRGGLRSALRG